MRSEKFTGRNLARVAGFTLLELLIAISIIGVLLSVSFTIFRGLTDQSKEEATNATIQKINRLFEDRKVKFDRLISQPGSERQRRAINRVLTLLRGLNFHAFDSESPEVLILAKKTAFLFDFPQRMIHRTNLGDTTPVVPGMPGLLYDRIAFPASRQELINEGNASPTEADIQARVVAKWAGGSHSGRTFSGHQPGTESSELLYFISTVADDFGAPVVDSERFTTSEVQDTDNDGLPEFVDGWGTPLRYYPFPTLLINPTFRDVAFRPQLPPPADATDTRTISNNERKVASVLIRGLPPAPSPLANGALSRDLLLTDPDDPVGILYTALEKFNGQNGMPDLSTFYNATNFHTPDTYHAPLIVSAGPDLDLGLYDPHEIGPGMGGNLAGYRLSGNATQFDEAMNGPIADNLSNRNRRSGGRR